jgi:hypothetical protein
MLYVGIDYHKRYSQVNAIDEQGPQRAASRLPNDPRALATFFRALGEPCQAVLEAGWNWGLMYDWLEQLDSVTEIQLAHPYRTRAIAAAQVKTDAIDARTLAQLLRAGLIPRAHIPSADTRQLRELVRQRSAVTMCGIGHGEKADDPFLGSARLTLDDSSWGLTAFFREGLDFAFFHPRLEGGVQREAAPHGRESMTHRRIP